MRPFPPYLTADVPGTGGIIKAVAEDFVVEEIPAYLPCGSGEHVYLTVEKRGITTLEAIRRIAKKLGALERDIGYAGMKDSVGVTRQTLSLQRIRPEDAEGLEFDGGRVLAAIRHTNKLKLGHLKGNRFRIVVRDVCASSSEAVSSVLAILQKRGVPNFFGYQRYGAHGNSHLIGEAMLRRNWKDVVDRLMGDPETVRDEQWQAAISNYQLGDLVGALRLMPRHCCSERDVLQRLVGRPDAWEKAFGAVHPRLKKLYLSAYQSYLFDKVVERRLTEIDCLLPGDLACKHVNGACFLVEDVTVDALRAEQFEISATGPMFGSKMKMPAGVVLELEQQLLSHEGIQPEDFDLGNGLRMEGERRPLRVPLGDPLFKVDPGNLVLEFSLPKGSYATSVVREITKTF
ncbi:MAG: tRNA pseudouridine(13) synthase TruD [Desulfuromonadaceae bacterium GWB2_53_15]|nr:MAG: tRNA pseudouridine(13) synthase TruD [Desulfuromonadales bacterium GWD2_54_10]OHB26027.1 MAG: tRNA pseudouridine(13) synthase TruD [Desulfuromonadaceae bacterium GWB2_53_15]